MNFSYKLSLFERLKLFLGVEPIRYTNEKGKIHRDINDGPAVIFKDNHQYFENGVVKRVEHFDHKCYFNDDGSINRKEYSNYSIHYIDNDKFFIIGSKEYSKTFIYSIAKLVDITVDVEEWLEERNIDYNTMSEEDRLAFNFYIRNL